ncbi:MAG: Lrp/AsnC family transcriptional regulator [Pseudomonadota bacterium]
MEREEAETTPPLGPEELDRFDRQILSLLSVDARRTGEQLSDLVGLSPAACLRRVQRLRATGVIKKEIAVIAPGHIEETTVFVVLVEIERHNPQSIDAFAKVLRSRRQVERIFSVTGEADLVLIMRCASMGAFAAFAETYFGTSPVAGYETLVVFREYPADGGPE